MNITTEPVQSFIPDYSVRVIRARYHAMPSYKSEYISMSVFDALDGISIPFTGVVYDSVAYKKEVAAGELTLWNMALKNGNVGMFIHYLQDEYAHKGFYSSWGHPPSVGSTADYVSHNKTMAFNMAMDVIKRLKDFMKQYLNQPSCSVNEQIVWKLINALYEANPYAGIDAPFFSLLSSFSGLIASKVKALGNSIASISTTGDKPKKKNPWEMEETPYVAAFGNTGPDVEKARAPLGKILGELLPEFTCYEYTRKGPAEPIERVTIDTVPVWDIEGYWKYPSKTTGYTCLNDSEAFVFQTVHDSIQFHGKFCWNNGTYDKVKKEYTFSRFPAPEEMDDSIPQIAKEKVDLKLKWHMVLKLECNPNGTKILKEYLYKGIVKIPEDRDASGNLLRKRVEEAYVDEKKFGWGEAKETDLHWSRVLLGD